MPKLTYVNLTYGHELTHISWTWSYFELIQIP